MFEEPKKDSVTSATLVNLRLEKGTGVDFNAQTLPEVSKNSNVSQQDSSRIASPAIDDSERPIVLRLREKGFQTTMGYLKDPPK